MGNPDPERRRTEDPPPFSAGWVGPAVDPQALDHSPGGPGQQPSTAPAPSNGVPVSGRQPSYGQPSYGQPGYGQPAQDPRQAYPGHGYAQGDRSHPLSAAPARPAKRATGTLQIVVGLAVLMRAVVGLLDLLHPEPGDPSTTFTVVVTVGCFVLGVGSLVVGCYLKVTRARARDHRAAGHRPG